MEEARHRFKESIIDPNLEGEQGIHLGSDLGPRQTGITVVDDSSVSLSTDGSMWSTTAA
jgi:hypothetical protein